MKMKLNKNEMGREIAPWFYVIGGLGFVNGIQYDRVGKGNECLANSPFL